MNSTRIIRLRNPRPFNVAVYVTLTVLVIVSVIVYSGLWPRLLIVALCLLYGLVYRLGYYAIGTFRQANTYFATQSLILTGLMLLSGTSDMFSLLFFILGINAVLVLPNRIAIMWVALFYLIDSGSQLVNRGAEGALNVLFNIAVFALTYVYAYTVRQAEIARRENEQLLEELRAAQGQLQDLAVAEERNRLARDLHDSVKQQVFAATMQLGAARVMLERAPHAAAPPVIEAERLSRQAGMELSLLIHELRPVALGAGGLPAALRAYATDWARQSGVPADVQVRDERPLPPAAEHALLRITQEALANVARHSQARAVTIHLAYEPKAVTLAIADDGRGFDPSQVARGVGLDSMRERVQALGGQLKVASGVGAGTMITAHYDEARTANGNA